MCFFFSCLISNTYINNGNSEGEGGGETAEEGEGRRESHMVSWSKLRAIKQ